MIKFFCFFDFLKRFSTFVLTFFFVCSIPFFSVRVCVCVEANILALIRVLIQEFGGGARGRQLIDKRGPRTRHRRTREHGLRRTHPGLVVEQMRNGLQAGFVGALLLTIGSIAITVVRVASSEDRFLV